MLTWGMEIHSAISRCTGIPTREIYIGHITILTEVDRFFLRSCPWVLAGGDRGSSNLSPHLSSVSRRCGWPACRPIRSCPETGLICPHQRHLAEFGASNEVTRIGPGNPHPTDSKDSICLPDGHLKWRMAAIGCHSFETSCNIVTRMARGTLIHRKKSLPLKLVTGIVSAFTEDPDIAALRVHRGRPDGKSRHIL